MQNWRAAAATVLLTAVVLQGTIVYAATAGENAAGVGSPAGAERAPEHDSEAGAGIRTLLIPLYQDTSGKSPTGISFEAPSEASGEGAVAAFVREYPQNLYRQVSAGDAVGNGNTAENGNLSGVEAPAGRYASLELTIVERQLLVRVVCLLGQEQTVEEQEALLTQLLDRLLEEKLLEQQSVQQQSEQQSMQTKKTIRLKDLVYGREGLCDAADLNAAEITQEAYDLVERVLAAQ